MDSFGLLLTALLLIGISNEPTENPEILTTSDHGYEYAADPQFVTDVSFDSVHSELPSEDYAEFSDEPEDIPPDYYKHNVMQDNIQYEPTVIGTTEMEILYEGNADFVGTTQQVELDATPTMQADTDKIEVTDTSVTPKECTPLYAGPTPLKFATLMLIVVGAAVLISIMVYQWIQGLILFFNKDENTNKVNTKDPELGEVKHQDTFTI